MAAHKELPAEDKAVAAAMSRGIRQQFDGLNANAIALMLEIAAEPGLSLLELSQRTGIPRSTISRLVLDLSGHARGRQQALEFIQARTSVHDLRRKEYRLTPLGDEIVRAFIRATLHSCDLWRRRRIHPS